MCRPSSTSVGSPPSSGSPRTQRLQRPTRLVFQPWKVSLNEVCPSLTFSTHFWLPLGHTNAKVTFIKNVCILYVYPAAILLNLLLFFFNTQILFCRKVERLMTLWSTSQGFIFLYFFFYLYSLSLKQYNLSQYKIHIFLFAGRPGGWWLREVHCWARHFRAQGLRPHGQGQEVWAVRPPVCDWVTIHMK